MLALVPPVGAVVFAVVTAMFGTLVLDAKCESAVTRHSLSSQCRGVLPLAAKGAVAIAALLPTLISFVSSTFVTFFSQARSGLACLVVGLLLFIKPLYVVIVYDIYDINSQVRKMIGGERREPSKTTGVGVIERYGIFLNLVMIFGVSASFVVTDANRTQQVHDWWQYIRNWIP